MRFLVRGKFRCGRKSPSPLPKPFYYLMTHLCWDLSLEGLEPIKKFTSKMGTVIPLFLWVGDSFF